MDLFTDANEKIDLKLPEAEVIYYPNFLSQEKATLLFNLMRADVDWQQDNICVYGKIHPQPRLTHLFAENEKPYSYSNITMYPTVFPEYLQKVKKQIEQLIETSFTTCLANLYRDGKDSNGWHADDEKELGINPVIASLSLGAPRWFHLKHKKNKELKTKIELTSGSLLVMQGSTQHHWLHQISKTKKEIGERINLTFRIIN